MRASDHAANASIHVTSLAPMPTARSETMKIAKTARLPATVAIVSSHQRRRTSLTVSLRNSASPSAQPSTGPRWIGRFGQGIYRFKPEPDGEHKL